MTLLTSFAESGLHYSSPHSLRMMKRICHYLLKYWVVNLLHHNSDFSQNEWSRLRCLESAVLAISSEVYPIWNEYPWICFPHPWVPWFLQLTHFESRCDLQTEDFLELFHHLTKMNVVKRQIRFHLSQVVVKSALCRYRYPWISIASSQKTHSNIWANPSYQFRMVKTVIDSWNKRQSLFCSKSCTTNALSLMYIVDVESISS